jgi:hypothetical protein
MSIASTSDPTQNQLVTAQRASAALTNIAEDALTLAGDPEAARDMQRSFTILAKQSKRARGNQVTVPPISLASQAPAWNLPQEVMEFLHGSSDGSTISSQSQLLALRALFLQQSAVQLNLSKVTHAVASSSSQPLMEDWKWEESVRMELAKNPQDRSYYDKDAFKEAFNSIPSCPDHKYKAELNILPQSMRKLDAAELDRLKEGIPRQESMLNYLLRASAVVHDILLKIRHDLGAEHLLDTHPLFDMLFRASELSFVTHTGATRIVALDRLKLVTKALGLDPRMYDQRDKHAYDAVDKSDIEALEIERKKRKVISDSSESKTTSKDEGRVFGRGAARGRSSLHFSRGRRRFFRGQGYRGRGQYRGNSRGNNSYPNNNSSGNRHGQPPPTAPSPGTEPRR